jgi:formylmethanofuran dehydrogenase subunit E
VIDEQELERIVEFHGHLCPGLAMGVQAAHIALREIGPHAIDEEVVAVVENDMCAVDAVQFLTGCTFGKGNLVFRDWGKNVYSFYRRSDGRAIRIAARPDAWDEPDPEQGELFAKMRTGRATAAETARFEDLHAARSRRLLERDPESLFTVSQLSDEPPQMARIHSSVVCDRCGEGVMETRVHLLGGRRLCPPCFEIELNADEE